MKNSGKKIEASAKDALLSCLSNIPFLKVIDTLEEFGINGVQAGLVAKVKLPGHVIQLIVEVKNSGQPRLAREAVNQLLRYKDHAPNSYFIFVAPYISQKSADICASEGVGYLDLSGNCLLSFDKVYIQKEGYPNTFKEKRELRSLYSPKAERILRVLLSWPGKRWKVAELAEESNVSLGQVSNVKRLLSDREFVSGERGGFKLLDPGELLREWAENYDYRNNWIQEFYSLRNIKDVEDAVADYCDKKINKYALTGFSGAARIAPAVRYKKAMIYISELSEDALLEVSLKKVKSGGNLLLFTPYDEGVFYGTSKVNGMQIVSDIQLYLDLQGFRGRGQEAAEVLFERIVNKAW